MEEEEQCNVMDCPRDCILSDDYDEWGPCSRECGGGTQVRRRRIIAQVIAWRLMRISPQQSR